MPRAFAPSLMPFLGAIPLLASILCGCDGTSGALVTTPTLISVRSQQFSGSVACRPGELRSYVVRLTNRRADAGQQDLLSLPTPCTGLVAFGAPPLRLNDSYTGTIYGYDVEVDAASQGSALNEDGVPSVVARSTGLPVIPRWTTTCGIPPVSAETAEPGADAGLAVFVPTPAIQNVDSALRGCIPFQTQPVDLPDGAVDAGGDGGGDEAGDGGGSDVDAYANPTPADGAIEGAADGPSVDVAVDTGLPSSDSSITPSPDGEAGAGFDAQAQPTDGFTTEGDAAAEATMADADGSSDDGTGGPDGG